MVFELASPTNNSIKKDIMKYIIMKLRGYKKLKC